MALRKHDSMIVTELISSFALLGTFAIACILFLIYQEIKTHPPVSPAVTTERSLDKKDEKSPSLEKKVALEDLDPQLTESINRSFQILEGQSQQSVFVINKLLEKNFSPEEIEAIGQELSELQKRESEQNTAPVSDSETKK